MLLKQLSRQFRSKSLTTSKLHNHFSSTSSASVSSSSTPLALLFPGQGSQFPGMGSNLTTEYPLVAELFAEADEALQFKLSEVMTSGSMVMCLYYKYVCVCCCVMS